MKIAQMRNALETLARQRKDTPAAVALDALSDALAPHDTQTVKSFVRTAKSKLAKQRAK